MHTFVLALDMLDSFDWTTFIVRSYICNSDLVSGVFEVASIACLSGVVSEVVHYLSFSFSSQTVFLETGSDMLNKEEARVTAPVTAWSGVCQCCVEGTVLEILLSK